jgi:hypothetical protein
METNELPEDVKRKIEDKLNEGVQLVKSLGLDKQVPKGFLDLLLTNNRNFAAWGYRLGLQSCEEQLKAKDEEIAKLQKANEGWENAETIKDMNADMDRLIKENRLLRECLLG